MRSLIATLLLLVACKGGGDKDKPDPSAPKGPAASKAEAPRAAAGFAQLKVEVGGKPVAIARAFIKQIAPDRFQLFLANQGGSCRELMDNMFDGGDDARIDVLADLTPRLTADGTLALEVSDLHEGGATVAIEPGSKATVGGGAAPGAGREVSLDFVATADGTRIEAHGTFTAEGCGVDDPGSDGVPRGAHPSTATVTIAGKQLAIRSAIIKGDEVAPVNGAPKVRDVVLSTGPRDCSGTTPWAEVILERHWGAWAVSGTWLKQPVAVNQMPDEGTRDLQVTLGATGTSEDGPTIAVELGGSGKVGDYPIALAGTVEAIDCGK